MLTCFTMSSSCIRRRLSNHYLSTFLSLPSDEREKLFQFWKKRCRPDRSHCCGQECPRSGSHSFFAALSVQEFLHEFFGVIDFVEAFENGGGIHRDGTGLFVVEGVVQGQALNISVENNPYEFAGAIH